MKKYVILLLIMAFGITGFAQTSTTATVPSKGAPALKKHKKHIDIKSRTEKVVINDKSTKTVIEIKNGKIYVDGNVVSSIKNLKSEDHKIVINHKDSQYKDHEKAEARERKEKEENWEKKEQEEKPERPERPERTENPERQEDNTGSNSYQQNHHGAFLGVFTDKNAPVNGAYVSRVIANSPAERAGIVYGDVITKVNGIAVGGSEDLVSAIAGYAPGDEVIISYSRGGNTDIARTTLGDKESFQQQMQQEQPMSQNWQYNSNDDNQGNNDNNRGYNNDQNWNNQNWNNDQRNAYGYENPNNYDGNDYFRRREPGKPVQLGISASDGRKPRGVYLDSVRPGSPAEVAGLQKGDDIIRINGERVRHAYEMQELLSEPGIGDIINIEYRRNKEKKTTEVHVNRNNN